MKKINVLLIAGIFTFFLNSCDPDVLKVCFDAPTEVKVNQRITLNAACSEGVKNYHWNFGDGENQITTTPTVDHYYKTAGNYEVTLHHTAVMPNSTVDHCPPNAAANGGVAKRVNVID
jgi:hypothetical protein